MNLFLYYSTGRINMLRILFSIVAFFLTIIGSYAQSESETGSLADVVDPMLGVMLQAWFLCSRTVFTARFYLP